MKQTAANTFALLLAVALLSPGTITFEVLAAKHLTNGSSLGKRHDSARRQISPVAPRPAQAAVPLPAPAGETWLLAGLTAGGLLAALFTGGAFNGIRFADIVMLGLLFSVVFFIYRMIRRKPENETMQYAALGAETMPSLPATMFGGAARPAPYPIGFEIDTFLRYAKEGFIRLLAAIDNKDLGVIRDYTTPETFHELSKKIAMPGSARQKTDIFTLEAELLELAIEGNIASASVRFSGLIRDLPGNPARPFYKIWNVQKSLTDPDSVWLLADVKQVF